MLLGTADRLADRRLGEAKFPRGDGKAAMPTYRVNRVEAVERGKDSSQLVHNQKLFGP